MKSQVSSTIFDQSKLYGINIERTFNGNTNNEPVSEISS